jgi:hypothetical protein
LFWSLAGFAAVSVLFLMYVWSTGSLSAYREYVWKWGSRYAGYYPISAAALAALRFTLSYLAMNNTLMIALVFVLGAAIARMRQTEPSGAEGADALFKSDVTMLLWLGTSYAGVSIGGRFYSHYFFQILPCLCLIGGRGLVEILSELKARSVAMRRVVIAALLLGFAFTLVRYHGRGVLLAADWFRGGTGSLNVDWYHELRNREERQVAAVVRDIPGAPDGLDRVGLEAVRAGGPRNREAGGPGDFVFVWGYRPEIYYWSGLLPASRFLSVQPLTGVPADVQ